MNYWLAHTSHFDIEWSSGVDASGLYIYRRLTTNPDEWDTRRGRSHTYIDLSLIPPLIKELRQGENALTLLSRVTSVFIPTSHRRPKKDGGDPTKAYYTPLVVEGMEREELASLLERALCRENAGRFETSDYEDPLLHGSYLENGEWASAWLNRSMKSIELQPSTLATEPKRRFLPCTVKYGVGRATLRVSKSKYRCSRAGNRRGAHGCIDNEWIAENALYIEHKQGSHLGRYHIKCAFRAGLVPQNWLSPHFEQYYILIEHGMGNWIEKEREKRTVQESEELKIPSMTERVSEFVQKLKAGYELDEFERRDWREHLRDCPVDIEPFQTARAFVGLPNPATTTSAS